MTRLVLVRHGESVATVARRLAGRRTCAGLTDLGRRQAAALRDRIADGPAVDVLVSSDFRRAVETAEILQPALAANLTIDPDVGEHDPGPQCDGMGFDEFVERFGVPDWEGNPYLVGFPGGETLAQFHLRVAQALYRLVDEHAGATLLVVCHGGVIDVAMRAFLRAPMTGDFELHTLNTSLTEAQRTERGRWRLIRYNDTAHLAGLPVATVPPGGAPA